MGGRRSAIFGVLVLLLISMSPGGLVDTQTVDAASSCNPESAPVWGTDAELLEVSSSKADDDWFLFEGQSSNARLSPLEEGFSSRVNISNNGHTAIRFQPQEGYRYTFCVTLDLAPNQTIQPSPLADIYLMEDIDYERYSMDEWYDDAPSDWYSFYGWIPYRDVHAYEGQSSTEFAVTYEGGGTSSSFGIFSSSNSQGMYLVLDAKNNSRDTDSSAVGADLIGEVYVTVEERVMLPKISAYLLCCSLPFVVIIAPLILHQRYNRGGWHDVQLQHYVPEVDLMHMVESTPESSDSNPYVDEVED